MNSQLEKDVKNRILMINEDLRRNLLSLELEDSMSTEEYLRFKEMEDLTLELSETADGIRLGLKSLKTDIESSLKISDQELSLKVKKKDAVTELNAEAGQLVFTTKKFAVDTPNFKVNSEGCYVNGTVYATTGKIANWSFADNTASGSDDAWMSGGNIYADSASCRYVHSKIYDFNPDSWGHEVNFANSDWGVGDSGTRKTTFYGNMHVHNVLHASMGLGVANGDIYCTRLRCIDGGTYQKKNVIYCGLMVAKNETYSDRRLKEDIEEITDAQAAVLRNMVPKSYSFIRTGRHAAGLIAQEVKELMPDTGSDILVSRHKGYLAISYEQLIPLMIKQIQNNLKKLDELKGNKHE